MMAWAGIAHVLAWLIGLFLAPVAPDPFGSAGTINAYFSAYRPAMIQSVFVHGLARVALLGLAAALWNYLAAGGHSRAAQTDAGCRGLGHGRVLPAGRFHDRD